MERDAKKLQSLYTYPVHTEQCKGLSNKREVNKIHLLLNSQYHRLFLILLLQPWTAGVTGVQHCSELHLGISLNT